MKTLCLPIKRYKYTCLYDTMCRWKMSPIIFYCWPEIINYMVGQYWMHGKQNGLLFLFLLTFLLSQGLLTWKIINNIEKTVFFSAIVKISFLPNLRLLLLGYLKLILFLLKSFGKYENQNMQYSHCFPVVVAFW